MLELRNELSNELSLQCQDRIAARVAELQELRSPEYKSELWIYSRILQFPFKRYPDYTVPWHLLTWPYMRWDHVAHVVQILESFRQPTGSHVGAPLVLEPFQLMILLAFLGPKDPNTGLRVVREGLLTLARKNGKLKRVDEPIPTPRGWVKNGDLTVGDRVFGVDGKPCTVIGAFPVEVPSVAYRLTFSDGTDIEVGAEHQWLTKHKFRPWESMRKSSATDPRRVGMNRRPVEQVVTTQQIAESLMIERADGQTEYNHSIPLCAPVEYPETGLPMDPYTLGVWLAEGSITAAEVTLSDEDAPYIVTRIRTAMEVRLHRELPDKACRGYGLGVKGVFITGLRDLGVFGNKYIPEMYLTASVSQRRALLQGLLDGDGHATRHTGSSSTVEILTKFDELRRGILELMRSLGLKPTSRLKEGTIDGEIVGTYHRIIVTAYREDEVLSVPRKLNALQSRPKKETRSARRQIVACERIESSPMRCIAVDGPDNLYLAGRDYVVTHNTAIVAGLATALMCLHPDDHGLRGQEIQVGASDRDQAGITHMMAERFVSMDDTLGIKNKFRSVPSKKTLAHVATLTTLKCLSSDAYRQLGGNPVMVLLDEIGNVAGTTAEDFYSALTTGFGAQEEPLTLLLSTQAPNDQHFFSQQVDRAKRVNAGMGTDNTFAGFVFTLPEVDADGIDVSPFDEDLWYLANPGLGTICNIADLRDWARRARELPALQNKYENLKLNRRVSETAAFLSRTVWEQNNVSFDPELLRDRECTLGLDLSETTDLTALAAVFEPMELEVDGKLEMRQPILMFYWIPGDGLQERSKRDKVPYDVWSREGLIDTTSRKVVDYGKVARKIIDLIDLYEVIALGFDRWKMKYLLKALEDEGYEFFSDDEREEFLVEVGQGYKDQTRSVELMETAALESRLAHAGHPILRWNIANTVVISDPAKNRKFEKTRSYGRIDGTVAVAVAIHARGEFDTDTEGDSMYDDSTYAGPLM